MFKVLLYLLRISITPFLIMIVVLPAFLFGWIQSQATFIILLLASGITGEVIQHYLVRWQKNRKELLDEESKPNVTEEEEEPLSKLPLEVQELIREGESLNEQSEGRYENLN